MGEQRSIDKVHNNEQLIKTTTTMAAPAKNLETTVPPSQKPEHIRFFPYIVDIVSSRLTTLYLKIHLTNQ